MNPEAPATYRSRASQCGPNHTPVNTPRPGFQRSSSNGAAALSSAVSPRHCHAGAATPRTRARGPIVERTPTRTEVSSRTSRRGRPDCHPRRTRAEAPSSVATSSSDGVLARLERRRTLRRDAQAPVVREAHRPPTGRRRSSPSGAEAVGRISTRPSPVRARRSRAAVDLGGPRLELTGPEQGPGPSSVTPSAERDGPQLASSRAPDLGRDVEHGVEIVGLGPEVHDACPQHEAAVEDGVGEEDAAVELEPPS